jgi:hypothetical protein
MKNLTKSLLSILLFVALFLTTSCGKKEALPLDRDTNYVGDFALTGFTYGIEEITGDDFEDFKHTIYIDAGTADNEVNVKNFFGLQDPQVFVVRGLTATRNRIQSGTLFFNDLQAIRKSGNIIEIECGIQLDSEPEIQSTLIYTKL